MGANSSSADVMAVDGAEPDSSHYQYRHHRLWHSGGGMPPQEDPPLLHRDSLTQEKAFIVVGMFAITLVFGFLPRALLAPERRADPRWRRAVSALSCFSGGVFVGACLLDLFPAVRESVDRVLDEIEAAYHTRVDYPVAEFVIVLGFFLVLLAEQIVLEFGLAEPPQRQQQAGLRRRSSATVGTASSQTEGSPLLGNGGGGGGGHGTFENGRSPPAVPQHDEGEGVDDDVANDLGGALPEVSLALGAGDNSASSSSLAAGPADPDSDGHHHHHHHLLDHSSLRSYLLLVALTFHSLFEGLAIGLQEVSGQLFSIFTAVIVHKAVMAFSLGLTVAQSAGISLRSFVASVLVFSAASPVGMIVGILVTDMQESLARDVANG